MMTLVRIYPQKNIRWKQLTSNLFLFTNCSFHQVRDIFKYSKWLTSGNVRIHEKKINDILFQIIVVIFNRATTNSISFNKIVFFIISPSKFSKESFLTCGHTFIFVYVFIALHHFWLTNPPDFSKPLSENVSNLDLT